MTNKKSTQINIFDTEHFADLDKLILVKLGYDGSVLGLSQFFANTPAASKNDASFTSGQKWHKVKNNQLALLV